MLASAPCGAASALPSKIGKKMLSALFPQTARGIVAGRAKQSEDEGGSVLKADFKHYSARKGAAGSPAELIRLASGTWDQA